MDYQQHTDYGESPAAPYRYDRQPPNSMATASLVMGILAVVTWCCCYVGLLFGSLGILFALLSRTGSSFRGQAKAGLILSGIVVALTVLVWGGILVLALTGGSWSIEPPVHNLPAYPDFQVPDNFLKGIRSGGLYL